MCRCERRAFPILYRVSNRRHHPSNRRIALLDDQVFESGFRASRYPSSNTSVCECRLGCVSTNKCGRGPILLYRPLAAVSYLAQYQACVATYQLFPTAPTYQAHRYRRGLSFRPFSYHTSVSLYKASEQCTSRVYRPTSTIVRRIRATP